MKNKEEIDFREKVEREFYFKAVWGIIGTAIFAVIVFAIVFFVAVDGEEDTKVPNLVGLPVEDAVIALQERALYPTLSVKNSTPSEKGLVISQDISAGSVVKAGRMIGITSSLGGVLDTVGSYEGQTLDAVKAELQKLFAASSSDPVLIIGEPVEVVSDEPEGTILAQDPPVGTEITEITEIIFHVSRGKEQVTYSVPTMKGLNFQEGLKKITQWSIKYRFSVRDRKDDEEAGVIVSQTPERGLEVPYPETVLEMVMTRPEDYPSEYSFGMLEIVVPPSPVTMPITFERVTLEGERQIIFNTKTLGGATTIPYLEEVGTRLILTVNGNELRSFTVRQQ